MQRLKLYKLKHMEINQHILKITYPDVIFQFQKIVIFTDVLKIATYNE